MHTTATEYDNIADLSALIGQWAAALYTLVGTARLNHLDPEAYLRHVLSKIADHPICRIQDLLPWNVAADVPPLKDQS